MNQRLRRSPFRFWSLALLWLGVGCAAHTDETNLSDADRLQPYSDEAPTTSSPAVADQPGLLAGWPRVDIDQMVSMEKIRRGTVINASHIIGNATVAITALDSAGHSSGTCTAQVINRFFLLTAAHCLVMWPSGSGLIGVVFRDGTGASVVPYAGPVAVAAEPNPQLRSKDTGILFLANGMNTCQGTIAQCTTSTPWNAVFQFFAPGSAKFLRSAYSIVGYGEDADGAGNPNALLRSGGMSLLSADFANNNEGFTTKVRYTADNQARPCHGDSGGPLIIAGGSRLIHNGIASDADPITCNSTSGVDFYSGLSVTQAGFVFNTVTNVGKSLGFGCGTSADVASGLFVFHCANDGSLYGIPK